MTQVLPDERGLVRETGEIIDSLQQIYDDRDYWQQFVEFLPEGWRLSGYTFRHSALFVSDTDDLNVTAAHAAMIIAAQHIVLRLTVKALRR